MEKSISNDNLAQDLARMKEIDKMQRQEILRYVYLLATIKENSKKGML